MCGRYALYGPILRLALVLGCDIVGCASSRSATNGDNAVEFFDPLSSLAGLRERVVGK